jgi:hypothetical protein
VWLNAEQLSPYDYWQFWRNTEDADVGRFLKLFTDLPLERIAELEALEGAQINDAKKVLADEATRMAHGEDEARKARDAAEKAFEQGALSVDLPTFEIPRPSWKRVSCWRRCSPTPAWPLRAARPVAWPRAAASRSTTRPRPTPTGRSPRPTWSRASSSWPPARRRSCW